jgi:TonB family protein
MRKLLIACLLLGALPAFGNDAGCSPSVRYLSTFRWANSSERSILPKRAVVRGEIVLSPNEKLFIYETGTTTITFPHSGEPKAEFKVVSGGKELLQVALANLPELKPDPVFAEGLRPTFAARLCPADGQNMVVVASGSGATGEGQFFLVFVGGNGQYHSFHLPVAKKGRVEVSAKEPDTFRLWSVVDSEDLGTARPHYEVSVHKLGEDGFHLVSTSKTKQGYDPGEFVNNPIVLKGSTSRSSTSAEQRGHVGVVAAHSALEVSSAAASDHLLKKIEPQYPPMAKVAGVQGTVVLKATVSPAGRVTDVAVVSGHPLLAPGAISAVQIRTPPEFPEISRRSSRLVTGFGDHSA